VIEAEDASLLCMVEIFRHKADDTVCTVPVSTSCAVTGTIDYNLTSWASLANSSSVIPKSVIGT